MLKFTATKVDEVKLKQIFGGARGIKMMVGETSQLDPVKRHQFPRLLYTGTERKTT